MENEKEILENEDIVDTAALETEAELVKESADAEEILPPKQKKSGTAKIVLISVLSTIVALALLVGMLYLVLKGAGVLEGLFDKSATSATEPAPTENSVVTPDHTYTFDDVTLESMQDNVVAKAGNLQLNNAQLQLYYDATIISFQNDYGMYLMYMGVDLTQPLDTQIFDETTGQTWQDFILDSALQTWHCYSAVKQYADAEGYVLNEEDAAYIAGLDDKIQEMVAAYESTSAEQMVKEHISAGATVDALRSYMEMDCYYGSYINFLQEKFDMTDDEAVQYYTENEEVLNQNGITKENGDVVDVRHVLVQLDDSETDETGKVVYSEEQWEACRVKAQELYDSWLAGEANEDTFAQLAKDNSKDGNAAEGGLYTDVTKDAMVETFDEWIFDENRVTGDSGLVKTPYGYHIMYFVNRKAQWIEYTRQYVISERINGIIQEAMETYALESYMDQVGVSH